MEYKVLIADDEVDIANMLRRFFQSRGYRVFSAASGSEAVALAQRGPDIILLDVNMPGWTA